MRLLSLAIEIAVLASPGLGQIRKATSAFYSAEVRPSSHLWNAAMQGGLFRSGRFELRQATLVDLIKTAYSVDPDTIFGGPPWLDSERFDISAEAPPSTSQEAARVMLRNVLLDRFQLVIHEDTRPLPALVLTQGKGPPKMRQTEVSARGGCQAEPPRPQAGVTPYIAASCRGLTMEAFANLLRSLAAEYVNDPVVDTTGLEGGWDFDLKWTPRGPLMGGRGGGISLFDAVDKELGLKLEAHRMPMRVLVIDRVDHPPRTSALNTRIQEPLEFEVASIRPAQPDEPPTPPPARQFQPGGRVTWRGIPLRDLIRLAWDLDPDPHAVIVGTPKWLDSSRFDLIAKAPANSMASATQIFSDDLHRMLRAVLVDRFKMAGHYESRPVEVFTLVAMKPKLKRADPLNRPGCRMAGPQPPGEPGEGPPPHITVCRNVTMEQFANRLQDIGKSYIRYPVVDATGLDGAWDFTLMFHPAPPPDDGKKDLLKEEAGPRISIFSAIEKELGLKLQVTKRPMPVFVIDHLEPKPTEN